MEMSVETSDVVEVDASAFGPRGIGELLSAAVRNCTGSLYVTVCVLMLPMVALQLIGAYLMGEWGVMELQEQAQSGNVPPDLLSQMLKVWVFQGLSTIITVVTMYFAATGAARVVAERALGKPGSPTAAWDFLVGALLRVLGGSIIQGIMGGIILLVCMLPGVAALVGVMAASGGMQPGQQPPVLAYVAMAIVGGIPFTIGLTYITLMPMVTGVEQRGVFGALGRAAGLISGSFLRSWGVVLIVALIGSVPAGLLGWVSREYLMAPMQSSLGDAWGMAAASLPQVAVMLLVTPFTYGICTTLYLDLRSRRDDEDFTPDDLAFDMGYPVVGSVPGAPLASADGDPLAPAPAAEPPTELEPPPGPDVTP